MKEQEVFAQFVGIRIEELKKHTLDDVEFQRKVQEVCGQRDVRIGIWQPSLKQVHNNHIQLQRQIQYMAPVDAPSAVKTYLKLENISGKSEAHMTVYTALGSSQITQIIIHTQIYLDSSLLVDDWNCSLVWVLTPTPDHLSTNLHATIKTDFTKKIPIVPSLIDRACIGNAVHFVTMWIEEAKKISF